jgi:periplasmic protein TonB
MNDLLIHSPDSPTISDAMDLEVTVDDADETATLVLEAPAERTQRGTPPRSLFQRIAQGRAASPVAFVIALLVHAGHILLGFAYYKSVTGDRTPELVLPKGFAAESEESGAAVAMQIIADAPMPNVTAPTPVAHESHKELLGKPPGEFEPPAVATPRSNLDSRSGTAEAGEVIGLNADSAAPVVNFRSPPGVLSGVEAATPDSQRATAAIEAQPRPETAGSNSVSDAAGAPPGVPGGIIDSRTIPIAYPKLASDRGWGGRMLAMFSVDQYGRVADVRVIQSTDFDLLDEAAVSALKRWHPPKTLWGTVDNQVPFIFTPAKSKR